MFKRKLRKLMRDPKLFFADMAIKKHRSIDVSKSQIVASKPQKMHGHYQYTIVSAVYNVGRYLDEYIDSVTKQHLDFKKHLTLILVDDGSTDDSAAIIQKWQAKYPDNILYLYKENGGQASARNLGMQHVRTEWVTFADPDDILDLDYFHQIDHFAHKQKDNNMVMLCNNFIYYFDDVNIYKDTHPLKYRFSKGDAINPVNDLGKNMQLAVNSAIFKSDVILDKNIVFDDKVKPNFEDAHFIGCYLADFDNEHVGFVSKAKYYYRKRSDGSSTLDTAWEKKGLYNDVLVHGCVDMFNQYIHHQGNVPKHIQRTVLYHLIWYFKRLVNNKQKLAFLSEDEIDTFKALLNELFTHIDVDVILEFELAGTWFYHKVALLGAFKQEDPHFQIVYIEALDKIKGMVELRYFTRRVGLEAISIQGMDIIPCFAKSVEHEFLGDQFVIERRIWVPISPEQQASKATLKVTIGEMSARLSLAGKHHHNGVPYNQIAAHFESQKPKYKVDKKYQHAWLLMDRNTQADDNAEHLYRYIKDHHPEQDIYFVLEPSAKDWQRLSAEGFNMLAFGSHEHESALRSCKKLISSHIDKYVSNHLGPKMLSGRHLVFLQHGVTKDNLSGWLNSKEAINCFITATPDEYHSIAGDGSPYKFTGKDVVLTGFPRHDALLLGQHRTERLVVIMPTWRKTLVGNATQDGNERQLNPEFIQSDFARHWIDMLHSPSLESLAQQFGFKVAFYPHPLIAPCLELFNVPDYIEVMDNNTVPMQEVFSRAVMLITDYSSVAFDMAILNKASIYYQFDEHAFFNCDHSYTKGYYDYRTHGFGPVVTTHSELFVELESMLSKDCKPSQEILDRIAQTFPYRDSSCCERVYQAIIELDNPSTQDINKEILLSYAESASLAKNWKLALSRWDYYFSIVGHDQASLSQRFYLLESLREQGRLIEAMNILSSLESKYSESHQYELSAQKALLAYACREWHAAIKEWEWLGATSDNQKYIIALAEAQLIDKLVTILNYSENASNYHHALISIAKGNWTSAVCYLNDILADELSMEQRYHHKLLLSKAYRYLEQYEHADEVLNNIVGLDCNYGEYFYERIALNFSQEKFNDCKKQLIPMSSYIEQLPFDILNIALVTYNHIKDYKSVLPIIEKINRDDLRWSACLSSIGEIYFSTQYWEEAERVWEALQNIEKQANSRLLSIYVEQGKITKALALIDEYGFNPSSISEWLSCAELYSLVGRWNDAAHAWHHIIINFRKSDLTQHAWHNLRHAQLMQRLVA